MGSFYSCFVHSRLERVCLKFLPNLKMHRGWLTVITIALTLLVVGPTQARPSWNVHHDDQDDMTSGMVTDAVEGAKQSILNYPDNTSDMAEHLQKKFENKYGGKWQCIVSEHGYIGWSIRQIRNIQFRVNGIRFLLFQTAA